MSIAAEKTVRAVALENPAATRVLEELGIDYCCGGGKTLAEACGVAHVPVENVVKALESSVIEAEAREAGAGQARNWQAEPLSELIAHIQNTHHRFTRQEIARIGPLLEKVRAAHAKNHPELNAILTTFEELAQELTAHLMKEEMMLFPYIVRLEEASLEKAPVVPPPFGTARNPVAMMMREHDNAGEALRSMRQASNGYTTPADACLSYQTLYRALPALEADLHQHIHLENNILFPRAIEMESGAL